MRYRWLQLHSSKCLVPRGSLFSGSRSGLLWNKWLEECSAPKQGQCQLWDASGHKSPALYTCTHASQPSSCPETGQETVLPSCHPYSSSTKGNSAASLTQFLARNWWEFSFTGHREGAAFPPAFPHHPVSTPVAFQGVGAAAGVDCPCAALHSLASVGGEAS